MRKYKYTPLQPDRGEIRLLRLLPGDTSPNIGIEIFHARPDSNPEYEALSYVWGCPERINIISVHERVLDKPDHRPSSVKVKGPDKGENLATLAVTKNLIVALRHLRDPREPRILWIDAICINQEDLSERSVEVRNMGTIYSRARQVIVWLGAKSENSTLAIETLEIIGKGVEYSKSVYTSLIRLPEVAKRSFSKMIRRL